MSNDEQHSLLPGVEKGAETVLIPARKCGIRRPG